MKYKDVLLYKILRPIIKVLFKIIWTPKYHGLENIPECGSVVLAGNHTSILDCLYLISSTKRNIHFLAKEELWHGPKKILFNNMGLIPVNRSIHDHDALVHAKKFLENNLVVGVFPEGTTRKGRKTMRPFKFGAVKMAHDTKSKIVPFVINGKYKLFSKSLKIKFLKPITIGNDLESENNRLYKLIESELEE